MGIIPHNWISTKQNKFRGCAIGSCRTIINKQEGGTIYLTMYDSRLFILGPFNNICKQLGPTIITPAILLWLLLSQDTPHGLINEKNGLHNGYLLEKRIRMQPTAEYMQML